MMTQATSELNGSLSKGKIPPGARLFLGLVLLGAVYAFADVAIRGFSRLEPLSMQSTEMLARSETWTKAVQPRVWPPGYPLVLWLGRQAGIPPAIANRLLFVAALAVVGLFYPRMFPGSNPLWFCLLYTACAFQYFNLAQFTSETLVIPLSLVAFWTLDAYIKRRSIFPLLGLSVCCSIVFISRFHALAWLLPIVGLHLLCRLKNTCRQGWRHLAVFILIALLPVGLVMSENLRVTRHLTGMRRFDRELRKLPSELEYYRESIDLDDNIRLTAKTVYLDFLSLKHLGTHEDNRSPYRIPWPEWAILAALAAVLGTRISALGRKRLSVKHLATVLRREYRETATPAFLAGEFFVWYVLITIVLWSVGNNDPIYSRFMYPSYPFLMLWGFGVYSSVKKDTTAPIMRWPFRFFYFFLLAANFYKIGHFLGWLH